MTQIRPQMRPRRYGSYSVSTEQIGRANPLSFRTPFQIAAVRPFIDDNRGNKAYRPRF
jgi:hypothetical protein